jgi:hypothetical protein
METSVFDLPVAMTSAWIFNSYVIDTGDGLVVVDPGLPMVAEQAIAMIEQDLDRSAADIGAVHARTSRSRGGRLGASGVYRVRGDVAPTV